MRLEILGAESMGVRSLCCLVTVFGRRIVIVRALEDATDVVFSHFHGDHVPLMHANPYQLSVSALPPGFGELRCWTKSDHDLSADMNRRFGDLMERLGSNMQIGEGQSEGLLSFSHAVPHGSPGSGRGTVMMTRIEKGNQVFVHASDIQLLDDETVDVVIGWQPSIVLAAGPPLYLGRLSKTERNRAWNNAVRLVENVDVAILDHHVMRGLEGEVWLDRLSRTVGRRVHCAADFTGRPRRLLEAKRAELYRQLPVPEGWHEDYENGRVDLDEYLVSIP
jgi:predicted metallo-beta-lactamase superfamily hydrolase